jgi:aryl-alcohol dehydrogenase-like predicted oxidoreductase
MQRRTLGREGLTVTSLGLGCMEMSEFYTGRDDEELYGPFTSAAKTAAPI